MKIVKPALFLGFALICCVATGVVSSLFVSNYRSSEAQNFPAALLANTSDRLDGYLTCTGYVDAGVEAVYVLDSTTGMLSVGVLSKHPAARGFQARYQGNVLMDLEKAITVLNRQATGGKKSSSRSKRGVTDIPQVALAMPAEPKYIMSVGSHDITSTGNTRFGASALYVTEVNTGLMFVYILPWNPTAHSSNSPVAMPISYYTIERFLVPMVVEESVDEG
ncbi:MAG: hypothetical protein Q4D38_01305 [Planctomycetia bacterium]|nr:hypothetical protein [Planctomycetia bacterium]